MPVARPLRNAPIVEAIIDFRVSGTTVVVPDTFTSVKDKLAKRFPTSEVRQVTQAQLQISGANLVADKKTVGFHGLFLKSADGLTVVQLRPDGFTVNRLKPYTSWDFIAPEVIELWSLYAAVVQPKSVTRIALRYVNRLEMPLLHGRDFSAYLTAAPAVPPELPQNVSGFQTFVTIVDPATTLTANIIQSLESADANRMLVLLDIDAYTLREHSLDDQSIRGTLDELRTFKNSIFFSSLTENALRYYE